MGSGLRGVGTAMAASHLGTPFQVCMATEQCAFMQCLHFLLRFNLHVLHHVHFGS